MRIFRVLNLFLLLCFAFPAMADDIVGFWQTMDKKTHRPSSVIAVYSYQGKCYGRIIGIFDKEGELTDTIYHPISKATAMVGDPYYCGLDIVLAASPKEDGTYRGRVMDPRDGKVYKAELWREGSNLVLRGKLLIFGKNVTWLPFSENSFTLRFKKPDLSTFVPVKAVAKD
ncbi:MAG: DUF2147 domain-containing protein [Verrucomicrobia bacterium]|nr:DUF2147 domain-containing protein [Verrucomicrobiota bacterium]